MPGQEQIVKEYYEKNPSAIDSIRGSIYEEKILKEIKKKAKVNKKELSKDEAEKILKEENEKNIKEQEKLMPHSHDHSHDRKNKPKTKTNKTATNKDKRQKKSKTTAKKTSPIKKVSKK